MTATARAPWAVQRLMSSGFAAGPVLLTLVGRHGMAPFAICTVFVLAAFTLVSMPWMHAPRPERPAHSGLWRYIGLAPIAICVTLLMAMLEAASSAFLPLYALHMGWTERQATLLLSVMLLGAIVLQTPLGWLADRLKTRALCSSALAPPPHWGRSSGLPPSAPRHWPTRCCLSGMACLLPCILWPCLWLAAGFLAGIWCQFTRRPHWRGGLAPLPVPAWPGLPWRFLPPAACRCLWPAPVGCSRCSRFS